MQINLPREKEKFLIALVEKLSAVPGVEGVALGGSWSRGFARPESDMDVALYYHEESPFQIDAIRAVAQSFQTGALCTVTDLWGWGAWVNGGAWIDTAVGRVDFLYRSIEHVQRVINESKSGIYHHDFGQQPPFGFFSVTYLGETNVCFPLFDPKGEIERLKQQVKVFPPALRQKLIQDFLWMTEFDFMFAEKFISREDIYNTAGCMTRAAVLLVQVLFALNETYFINDKTALIEIEGFGRKPHLFNQRIQEIVGHCGTTPAECRAFLELMRSLYLEVKGLCA